MKLKVVPEKCIGCGACIATSPDVYDFNDEGLAEVIQDEVADDMIEDATIAKENCPTDAIIEI